MGWFPGYAINVETGERLNIMFGENSWLSGENGRDMLWNPTDNVINYPSSQALFGGQHYIYIMGSSTIDTFHFPRYDKCSYLYDLLLQDINGNYKNYVFASATWVGIPLSQPNQEWLSNDVCVKIRVSKKYNSFDNNKPPKYTFKVGNNSLHEEDIGMFNTYPNPVSSSLYIGVDDSIVGKDFNVTIYNVEGKQVFFAEYLNALNKNELNVSRLNGGIYVMEINGDDLFYVQKIIVNR